MHDPATPESQRVTDDMRGRRTAGLVLVLLVVFIGVAIAKPWGSPVEPAPFATPSRADVTPPATSLPTTVPEVPSAGPSAKVVPLPVAFTTPLPPASATWTGLRWRRLAPDDPLTLIASVLQWRRGYVAVGWQAEAPLTPVWTSADGTHWDPLIFGTSTTFWPGLAVLGVAELPTGLVAVTEAVPYCDQPCPLTYVVPVVSWTSADGRRWTPNLLLPPEWLSSLPGQPPLFAVGPAGLVVASSGPGAHLATSTDGSHWHLLPADGFPARFVLNDLHGTATGYVAVGHWLTTTEGVGHAAALWSPDGRHWSATPTLLPTSSTNRPDVGSAVDTLVVGPNGMIAVGRGVTTPGAALWWQSSDGRRWQPLPTFAPLGPTTCPSDGCSVQPNGTLVGDGHHIVAVRGGADGGVWTSTDGLAWRRLPATGDIPSDQAYEAVLLPGGVLLSDGTTYWFGEAQGQ
jgi:hypothetical protein